MSCSNKINIGDLWQIKVKCLPTHPCNVIQKDQVSSLNLSSGKNKINWFDWCFERSSKADFSFILPSTYRMNNQGEAVKNPYVHKTFSFMRFVIGPGHTIQCWTTCYNIVKLIPDWHMSSNECSMLDIYKYIYLHVLTYPLHIGGT